MRYLLKQPPVISALVSLVLIIIGFIWRLACDGHPPAWVELTFGLFGLLFALLTVLMVIIEGMAQCFSRISRWARIDSWGHFIPMLIFVAFVSASVLFAFAVLVKWKYPNLQSRGEFGDSFGALNTFFSTAAFLALLVSIAMQRRQMMDEREKDKIEQEQKRRASWPAVVVANQRGYISLYGSTNNGMPIIKLHFIITLRNVSLHPILNVFPKIQLERFDSVDEFIEAKGGGSICIEPSDGAEFDFRLTYAIPDFSDKDKVVRSVIRDRHLFCTTAFGTAQRMYYSASQMSVISLISPAVVRNDILTFLDWVQNQLDKGDLCNKQYSKEFSPHQYSFSVLPLTCDLREITYEEYKTAVADGVAR